MILKGSIRGNGSQLSRHLLNDRDNDHVELHEVRGFVGDDLDAAFLEAEAIAKGTRCQKFLFSLSLNPPESEDVSIDAFEAAIEMAEQQLGLNDQPRAVVFHEKEGRRHAHVVWSRIDNETMTARTLPYYKNRLMDLSQELYLENGWDLPKGFVDRSLSNPLNMSREEWQQAKRTKQDPRIVKAMFKTCWETSDSARALQTALEEKGYLLARGDRRGVVAVDFRGQVYSLSRYAGVKAKDIKERFPSRNELPSVDEAKSNIADRMTVQLRRYAKDIETGHRRIQPSLELRKDNQVAKHREERKSLNDAQEARWTRETNERAARLPKGLGGLWSRMTGRYGKIRRQNEIEAWDAFERDRDEKDQMISRQLEERRGLQVKVERARAERSQALEELNADIAEFLSLKAIPETKKKPRARSKPFLRNRDDRGPDLEL